MTTLDVAVTAENIADGARSRPNLCPVALGIRRALHAAGWPATAFVSVAERVIIRRKPGQWPIVVPTPRLVYARIQRYDRGANIRPFNFSLELPEKS